MRDKRSGHTFEVRGELLFVDCPCNNDVYWSLRCWGLCWLGFSRFLFWWRLGRTGAFRRGSTTRSLLLVSHSCTVTRSRRNSVPRPDWFAKNLAWLCCELWGVANRPFMVTFSPAQDRGVIVVACSKFRNCFITITVWMTWALIRNFKTNLTSDSSL